MSSNDLLSQSDSGSSGFMGKYDPTLFWGTLILCISITLWGIMAPEGFSKAMTTSQSWISLNFGWFFMLSVSIFIVFLAWAGLGRYGDIPLGQDGEKPEFSFTSWIAMLFSCGIGIGFIFWGLQSRFTITRPLPTWPKAEPLRRPLWPCRSAYFTGEFMDGPVMPLQGSPSPIPPTD